MRSLEDEVALDLFAAAGIGVIAGLRSMTAPAVVALAIQQHWAKTPPGKFSFLEGKRTARVLCAMAAGELVVDKLPGVPKRTAPPSLTARVATGAFAAAALSASRRRSKAAGAILGGLGAVAGSFLGYNLRKRVGEKTQAKDAVVAMFEDAIAVGGAMLLATR